jgi:hypothetical protein
MKLHDAKEPFNCAEPLPDERKSFTFILIKYGAIGSTNTSSIKTFTFTDTIRPQGGGRGFVVTRQRSTGQVELVYCSARSRQGTVTQCWQRHRIEKNKWYKISWLDLPGTPEGMTERSSYMGTPLQCLIRTFLCWPVTRLISPRLL